MANIINAKKGFIYSGANQGVAGKPQWWSAFRSDVVYFPAQQYPDQKYSYDFSHCIRIAGIAFILLTAPIILLCILQFVGNNSTTTDRQQLHTRSNIVYKHIAPANNTTRYYHSPASSPDGNDLDDDREDRSISAIDSDGYSKIYEVGEGSGDLTIDGNSDTYIDNSLIRIAPGVYGTINIQNLKPATKITITNGNGVVAMDGGNYPGGRPNIYAGLNYSNCNNLLISGNGSADKFGFYIHDSSYRPTSISGSNQNVTLKYFLYQNIGDYTIKVYGSNTAWNGKSSNIKNSFLKFRNSKFDNCGGIQLGGQVTETQVTDLTRGIEFSYDQWINCNSGILVFAGATERLDVHNNTFTHINDTNNNDNGFFLIVGNGSFYRNYAKDYQGHIVRLWSLTFGSIPALCLIYDNINIGSRKYSPFEWQSTEGENVKAAPNTTYVNIKLYNNTGGNLNYEQHPEFDACLVDNYAMPEGSVQEVYNNMLYNTFTSTSIPNRIFQFSNTELQESAIANKNIYYTNNVTAGFNETTLSLSTNSPAKNAGLTGYLVDPLDYHNLEFAVLTPSIGAIK